MSVYISWIVFWVYGLYFLRPQQTQTSALAPAVPQGQQTCSNASCAKHRSINRHASPLQNNACIGSQWPWVAFLICWKASANQRLPCKFNIIELYWRFRVHSRRHYKPSFSQNKWIIATVQLYNLHAYKQSIKPIVTDRMRKCFNELTDISAPGCFLVYATRNATLLLLLLPPPPLLLLLLLLILLLLRLLSLLLNSAKERQQ